MLNQSGLVILKEVRDAASIPYLRFTPSWIQFTCSLHQNQKNRTEEAGLIAVAECLILFEEYIKKRKMLVTSNENPTSGTNPSPEKGSSGAYCTDSLKR
jgi:hypothetical protein